MREPGAQATDYSTRGSIRGSTWRDARRLSLPPAFVIAGAMKSGTTTLHRLLDGREDVFIPPGEVNLFAVDDLEQFPQASCPPGRAWVYQDFERFFEEYDAWHTTLYQGARPGQVLGEDSVTYLGSPRALERLARHAPDAKILIVLRDPVERLRSHYWHWVRTGRAFVSLEDTLRLQQGSVLLRRSYYEEQLRDCFDIVGRDRVHVLLFERLVQDQRAALAGVHEFLGLESTEDMVRQHANPGYSPTRLAPALFRNWVFRDGFGDYGGRVPRLPAASGAPRSSLPQRLAERALTALSGRTRGTPPMRLQTRAFLLQAMRARNEGLPALLDSNLSRWWPTFSTTGSTTGKVGSDARHV